MWDYLDSIRERPEHERQNIAFILALGIAGIVLVVWASIAANRISLALDESRTQTAATAESGMSSFFEVTEDSASAGVNAQQ